jgi:hypothetical protein
MSCVCILTPVVIAAWPAFSASILAAASSLGYVVEDERASEAAEARRKLPSANRVELEIPRSEIVSDRLSRDQRVAVTKNGVTVTFSRDARGRASVCVAGKGHRQAELQALGEDLSRRVVQQYVYRRLLEEIQARKFVVVEEELDANQGIRLKVRHWEE